MEEFFVDGVVGSGGLGGVVGGGAVGEGGEVVEGGALGDEVVVVGEGVVGFGGGFEVEPVLVDVVAGIGGVAAAGFDVVFDEPDVGVEFGGGGGGAGGAGDEGAGGGGEEGGAVGVEEADFDGEFRASGGGDEAGVEGIGGWVVAEGDEVFDAGDGGGDVAGGGDGGVVDDRAVYVDAVGGDEGFDGFVGGGGVGGGVEPFAGAGVFVPPVGVDALAAGGGDVVYVEAGGVAVDDALEGGDGVTFVPGTGALGGVGLDIFQMRPFAPVWARRLCESCRPRASCCISRQSAARAHMS